MEGYWTVVERLIVGVAEHEGNVVNAFAVHVVDGIATATANTDYLDNAACFVWFSEIENVRGVDIV